MGCQRVFLTHRQNLGYAQKGKADDPRLFTLFPKWDGISRGSIPTHLLFSAPNALPSLAWHRKTYRYFVLRRENENKQETKTANH